MATVVVLMIIVVLLGASGYWWRQAQGDRQSLEAFHTLIDRLQRIDRQRPPDAPGSDGGSPEDPAAPHIRIVSPARPNPARGVETPGAAGAEDTADWGPPVRVVPHPQPERAPVPASKPDGTARASSAPSARGVLFFDDLVPAARRPEPEAPKIIPVREGDRPWLATAHRYALTGTAALIAVIALIAVTVAATSSGGGGQTVSSNRSHPSASPSTTTVRVQPAPSSAAPGPPPAPPSSTSATSATPSSTAAPPAPPSGAPQLTQVSPASGSPGQQVTIAGAGFFSSDGLIVVRFGSAQATVDCPNQTTCQAIVPASPPGSPPAGTQVITVITGAGTSNPLTFNYT